MNLEQQLLEKRIVIPSEINIDIIKLYISMHYVILCDSKYGLCLLVPDIHLDFDFNINNLIKNHKLKNINIEKVIQDYETHCNHFECRANNLKLKDPLEDFIVNMMRIIVTL